MVKFLLTQKCALKTIDINSCLFEFAISNNNYEIAELLLPYTLLKSVSQYSVLYLPVPHILIRFDIIKILKKNKSYDNQNNDSEYISNFVHFFLNKSEDEKIEEIKKKIVKKNNALVSCFAAYILNEKEFEEFLEKYEPNINLVEKNTNMAPLMLSILNTKYDTLKVILSKYKDTINVKCKTDEKIVPLHLLSVIPQLDKEGAKMLLSFKDLDKNTKVESYSPLHLAVLSCNMDIVSFLLNDKDVNIHAENDDLETPFHLIFKCNKCLEMLKLFYKFSNQSFNLMKKNRLVYLFFSI